MKLMTMLCSLVVVLSTLLHAQTPRAQGPGRVTGIVLNEDGQPIAGANVCISTTTGSNTSMVCSGVITDQAGHFEIEHLAMGSFAVSAVKEEDGYPPNHNPENKVVLSPQEPTANVTIKLGPKAAMLIGSVKDSVTGKPVDNIRVHYLPGTNERAGSGTASGFMRGEFRLNLPTTSDFVIVVAAPGYKPWVYSDPANGFSLQFASGEQKSVDIELIPEPKATKDANSR